MQRVKMEQEKSKEAEQIKELYAKSVIQLEEKLEKVSKDLDDEKNKNTKLNEKVIM